MELLGTPIDLAAVTTDAYVVAGISTTSLQWENCYATTQLLGGDTRFVSRAAATLPRWSTRPATRRRATRVRRRRRQTRRSPRTGSKARASAGTWWTDWAGVAGERSASSSAAEASRHPPARRAGPAPGVYVRRTEPETLRFPAVSTDAPWLSRNVRLTQEGRTLWPTRRAAKLRRRDKREQREREKATRTGDSPAQKAEQTRRRNEASADRDLRNRGEGGNAA